MAVQGKYISDADLLAAIGIDPLLATSDDTNAGVPSDAVLQLVIDSAEGEVDSYLVGFQAYPIVDGEDRLIRLSALDFAVAFLFERHPEYVRNRDNKQGEVRYQRAVERMFRIQQARQRLPDENANSAPKNVGAIVTNGSPKFMLGCGNGWPI